MTARAVAIARIARAARQFPDIHFRTDKQSDEAALEPRDAALASAIEHHVLRRWLTLVAVLESHLSRPWHETETKLQAALLCGSAQLLLMDRVPDYAVIDETVEWAKSTIRPKAGGLVNAVLRKIAAVRGSQIEGRSLTRLTRDQLPLHDGRVLSLNARVFAEDALRCLAQQTSTPIELLEHWNGRLGIDAARLLAMHGLVHAPPIVHGVDGALASRLNLQPHEKPGFFVVDGAGNERISSLLRESPQMIVQDPTAAAAVEATRRIEPTPRLIVDACAGRGTKTRQLAGVHPNAQIIATDIDHDRLRSLRETFKGHSRVRVIEHQRLIDFAGQADLILLDVPCSNTGVLARRVEAKYRFSTASLRSLVDIQRQILADALRLANGKAWIAYTTCSVEPAENQQQAAWLTQWHPFQIIAQESTMPAGLPGEDSTRYHDGGYWALLQRKPVNT